MTYWENVCKHFFWGGNTFGVRGFRCLHKKCFLKKALALALGALGVFAVGLPVQAIENYQLNGITVYANKGNGTLVEPLGGLADQHQNIPLLGTKDALEVPFSSMTISRTASDYFSSPEKGFVDTVTLDPAVRDDSRSTFNNFIDIRGVMINSGSMYINGIPNMMNRTDQMFTVDTFVNKISVIAGPNIGIGGTAMAQYPGGGAIYFESKKADKTPNMDLTLSYQGNKSFSEGIDWGKRFRDNERYGIRLNASSINGAGVIKPEKVESKDFFANIDQKTSHSWSNLLVGYTHGYAEGAAKHFRFSKNLNHIPEAPKGDKSYVPKWAYSKSKNFMLIFNHEQKINDKATVFFNFGQNENHPYESVYTWGGRNLDENGNYTLEFNNRLAKTENKYSAIGLKGSFELGKSHHDYVINFDRNWQKNYGVANGWSLKGLTGNIYTDNEWDTPAYYMGHLKWTSSSYTNAYHVLDAISFLDDKLTVMLGYHHHYSTVNNATSGKAKYSAGSPTYAVSYRVQPNFVVYASHSEDFASGKTVGYGYKNEGEALDPYKTKQNEVGIKYKQGDLLHTLAYYTIKQANYGDWEDAAGNLYLRQIDDKKNKGVEYSIAGKVTDKWDVIGGISRVDARDVKTNERISQVAKWSGTLGLIYKPNDDWVFTAHLQYLGESPVVLNKTVTMPSHTLLHLGAVYQTNINGIPVTFNAKMFNVFNKRYWTPTEGRTQANVGEPRTFVFTTTFHF